MKAGRGAVLIAVAALLIFLVWRELNEGSGQEASPMMPTFSVAVARVSRQQIAEHVEALGTTSSWESIEIRPTVTEFVQTIHFTDAQLVKAGELLVTLVQDEEAAKLGEARAYLEEQIREVKRIEGLVASRSLSQNQLDERKTLLEIARKRVAAAEAAIADRTIRAPFDGALGLRSVSPGALVTPESVITTLDDIATLRLDFTVPSLALEKIEVGSTIEASTPALKAQRFSGKVIGIDPRVNPVDRSVTVRARLGNPDLLLKPGMLLNVDLYEDVRDALVVPEQAIVHYQTEHYVFRVDTADANRLIRQDIALGTRKPGIAEVLSGLSEGDLVVVEGLGVARPGLQVSIREESPAATGGAGGR